MYAARGRASSKLGATRAVFGSREKQLRRFSCMIAGCRARKHRLPRSGSLRRREKERRRPWFSPGGRCLLHLSLNFRIPRRSLKRVPAASAPDILALASPALVSGILQNLLMTPAKNSTCFGLRYRGQACQDPKGLQRDLSLQTEISF